MKKAIILAGGRGERLRPLTDDRPKTMVEILGNPLLAYQLHWLKSYGIQHVAIACGYQHEIIQKHFGDGSKWDLKIDYLVEEKPLGRGGALKVCMTHLRKSANGGPLIALNGDLITNLPIDDLYKTHTQHKSIATLVTVPLRSPYGIVDIEENSLVTGFREKPELPFWINAGIYLLNSDITDLLPDVGDHEETTLPGLAKSGQLRAYKSKFFWRTVDTAKDLTELTKEIENMFGSTPLAVTHS